MAAAGIMFATETVHEMLSMSEKMEPSNPKSEVIQEDVEEWGDADKGIVVSCTIAVED
jgi:malic enzyme